MSEEIRKSIEILGSQSALAKSCGVSQAAVVKWLNGGNMDVRFIPKIIKATNGAVSAQALRPDVDWETIKSTF